MTEELYLNYMSDLVEILIGKLEELKNLIEKDDYAKGQIFAYYDALDSIKSQADLFGIDIVKLKDIDLESYLQ